MTSGVETIDSLDETDGSGLDQIVERHGGRTAPEELSGKASDKWKMIKNQRLASIFSASAV